MRVLVLNCGSSSVKFRVIDVAASPAASSGESSRTPLAGRVGGIGGPATLTLTPETGPPVRWQRDVADHAQAVDWLFEALAHPHGGVGDDPLGAGIRAVGHRVVHGGARFSAPVLIDDAVAGEIDALGELAPLHNPACLAGIRGARRALGPDLPMVAVFDTAFHRQLPARARQYALPATLAERHGIRRYGFHGIAHASLLEGYLRGSGTPRDTCRVITVQLGNGCSMAAIHGGQSIDTSMGFTPLEGLVMGTRSGDLDPSIVSFLCDREGAAPAEVERWLNEESGLLGLSGRSNDMRELLAAVTQEKHEASRLAIDVFCYRAKKYLGAYLAALGGADAIVFGGGIGEASPDIRSSICAGMDWCGVVLDADRNAATVGLWPGEAGRISADAASVDVYVVAADEETWIGHETARCLRANSEA